MLELPESFVIANQLNETILGKRILESQFHTWPHKFTFYFNDYMMYAPLLKDKIVEHISSIGGNVEIEFGDVHMVLGDGLNIRYCEEEGKLPPKHQLLLRFTDGSFLAGSTQMYAVIQVFFEGENTSHYYTYAKEKPSPLTDEFNMKYFEKMFQDAKKNLSAKAFLATEQRIPGLGNGVLQDILFNAKLNPRTKLSHITGEELGDLYESIKSTLKEMAEKGGRDTEKDIFGHKGAYQTILSSKTIKEPCQICGNWITKQAYLGGSVYYCPKCQPVI